MTAFVVEAVLLIIAAFAIGVGFGFMLGRRRRARAASALPAAAPPFRPAVPPADPQPAPAPAAAMAQMAPPAAIAGSVPAEREPVDADVAIGGPVLGGAGGRPLPGIRPPAETPAAGAPVDDLKRLKGIGPLNEQRLHGLGIHYFRQIADWSPAEVEWVGSYLAFPGRIEREDWVGQARAIVDGASADALPMASRKSR